jgi:hypothetical protein
MECKVSMMILISMIFWVVVIQSTLADFQVSGKHTAFIISTDDGSSMSLDSANPLKSNVMVIHGHQDADCDNTM